LLQARRGYFTAQDLIKALNVGKSTAYNIVSLLKRRELIEEVGSALPGMYRLTRRSLRILYFFALKTADALEIVARKRR